MGPDADYLLQGSGPPRRFICGSSQVVCGNANATSTRCSAIPAYSVSNVCRQPRILIVLSRRSTSLPEASRFHRSSVASFSSAVSFEATRIAFVIAHVTAAEVLDHPVVECATQRMKMVQRQSQGGVKEMPDVPVPGPDVSLHNVYRVAVAKEIAVTGGQEGHFPPESCPEKRSGGPRVHAWLH